MRVAMFALVVGSLLGTSPVLAHAQSTGPVVRGQPGEVERGRDRDRRDGSWDWRRDDRGDRDRRDRYDDRRDRDRDRFNARRERELQKRYAECQRNLWRASRRDRYSRWDRWDDRNMYFERERIERACQRQVYGRGW